MSYALFTEQNLANNSEVQDSVLILTTMVNQVLAWEL